MWVRKIKRLSRQLITRHKMDRYIMTIKKEAGMTVRRHI